MSYPAPLSYASYYWGTPQLDSLRSLYGTPSVDADTCVDGMFYTNKWGDVACSGESTSSRKPWGKTLMQLHQEEMDLANRRWGAPSTVQDSGKRELIAALHSEVPFSGPNPVITRRDLNEHIVRMRGGPLYRYGNMGGQTPRYISDGMSGAWLAQQ